MKIESHVVVEGSPDFKLQAKSNPLAVEMGAEGCLDAKIGKITARIGRVPLFVTIPFLRRGGGVVAVGAIGPFRARLKPIDAHLRAFGVRFDGVLGKDGFDCDVDGKATGKFEVDLDATIPSGTLKSVVKDLIED